jgi:hypothetical protein
MQVYQHLVTSILKDSNRVQWFVILDGEEVSARSG